MKYILTGIVSKKRVGYGTPKLRGALTKPTTLKRIGVHKKIHENNNKEFPLWIGLKVEKATPKTFKKYFPEGVLYILTGCLTKRMKNKGESNKHYLRRELTPPDTLHKITPYYEGTKKVAYPYYVHLKKEEATPQIIKKYFPNGINATYRAQ